MRFFYNKAKERLSEDFASLVRIVAEIGAISDIWFGNSRGVGDYYEEIEKNRTKSSSVRKKVPYQQAPDHPQSLPKSGGK
ncbi:hypothetical protein [Dysgonomonas mossii]|uniref:hypothetical protein n=1 Tax=Dysgonomonas mossii TaxID=163665 RepID=UPI0039964C65